MSPRNVYSAHLEPDQIEAMRATYAELAPYLGTRSKKLLQGLAMEYGVDTGLVMIFVATVRDRLEKGE